MTRSGMDHPSPVAVGTPKGVRVASRTGNRTRIVLAIVVLAVAGTLSSAAIRGRSESTPGAIQLGQVPAAAVPTNRAGLHLIGPRSVDLLTRSGAASDTASGSTALGSGSKPTEHASATTITGPDSSVAGQPGGPTTGTTSDTTATGNGSNDSIPTQPTLPGVTVPTLSSPSPQSLPPGTVPPVTLPPVTSPATVPQATLPGVTVSKLPVPTTSTLPTLPLLSGFDFGGLGSR